MAFKDLAVKGWGLVTRSVRERWERFVLTPELMVQIRFVLFLVALLALFMAFQEGDDWYVRAFANYDWARRIGY